MNFAFTDDQLALAATVRDILRAHRPSPSHRASAWPALTEAGCFVSLVPESAGGLGLDLIDLIPALEETGRGCLPGPVVETAVAAPYLLEGLADLAKLGTLVVSAAPGTLAPDADLADLVVSGDLVATRERVRLAEVPGIDPCRRMFEVTLTGTPLPGSWDRALPRAVVATAAQLLGVARHLLDTSVAYAGVRTQFGAPIGSFQAVKHQLADVAIAVEFAAPLVYRAALSVGAGQAGRDVSAAKAAAGEAAALAARTASQVHGAIGYTHELDLRFWLHRAWSLSAAYGGAAAHRAAVRDALPGAARFP
ncbi:acyl-CoA dehydrogenase [Nonomuraea typhae]|uniref:acyl-CoA dehydrogenase n=1 Tax=Nonomuraea typhae TaxID=2603600 RepID=UPI0012FBA4B2|nr:acyl-CoA dehydrogenase [Nonomuraea typhae]